MKTKTKMPAASLDDDLKSRLSRLGLFGVVSNWEAIGNDEVVKRIVEVEETERQRRSLERRIKSAHLGNLKAMSDFDWEWPESIDREAVEDLFRLDFVGQAANVVLVGPNGIGKTMIAKNLAHQAVMGGMSALFVNAAELMNDLKRPESSSALARRLSFYAKPDVLVIDEVGYLAAASRDGDLFFQLVARRYEKKSLVITTNKVFNDWNQVFPSSACVVTLVDRLIHRAEILNIEGESYRLKEAKEREEKKRLARSAGRPATKKIAATKAAP